MTAVCPCCGVHRLTPKSPRIDEVPWGDCACSDSVTCVAHQINSTDAPSRPTDMVLSEKGQQIYVRRLKEHAETVERFASFDRAALQSQLDEALAECDRLRWLLTDAKDEARERSEFANAETEHANRWALRARKAEALLEGLCAQFEDVVAHADWRAAGSKGMQVPFQGDFAGAAKLPSVISRMRWWAKEIRSTLKGSA